MDGTIAEWKPGTLEEVSRPRYSSSLPVNGNAIEALRLIHDEAAKHSFDIYILSAVLPGTSAIQDKNEWIEKFCSYISMEHRLFVPYGANKAQYVMEALHCTMNECYLLDDYSINLNQWKEAGGHPIKMFNRINGKSMSYVGDYTCSWLDPEQMKTDMLRIMGLYPEGANRVSGGITDFKSHIPFVAAFGYRFKKCFQPRQMGCGNLFSTGKLLQQGVDRSNMQRRNKLFQFREQDTDQPGNGTFQFGTLFHLVKTVSGQ